MGAYSDDLRAEFLDLRDGVVRDLQRDGLIFAESLVRLAFVTTTGGDPDAGIPPSESTSWLVIDPRPTVDMRAQWRQREGAATRIGDGKLTITRSVTEEQLTTAAFVEVDGKAFTFVEGELKKAPGGLDWLAVVKLA